MNTVWLMSRRTGSEPAWCSTIQSPPTSCSGITAKRRSRVMACSTSAPRATVPRAGARPTTYAGRLHSVGQHAPPRAGAKQMKVILAREIGRDPKILVVCQPCKGLDVGAIEFVQQTLLEQRKKGVAILYISTELEHILMVC